jgi:F420-dependent oxidoreductase-like protein
VGELLVGAWVSPSWATEDIVALAQEAERTGYDSVWVSDHFMGNTGTEERSDKVTHECFALLAGLATAVPRVRLGSLVAGITYRHPAVLANIAGTIDDLSGGRLVLGVGAGWQLNEHAAYGIRLGPIRERLDRFEEGLVVLRGLLTEQRTTAKGEHYTIEDAPRVRVERPRVPLMIGGTGEQRMLGMVAKHADEWNCWSDPEIFEHKSTVLDQHCERIGRDPKSIHRSTQAVFRFGEKPAEAARFPVIAGSVEQIVDAIGQWRDAGLDELIVPTLSSVEEARDTYTRMTEEVLPKLR